MPASWVSPAVCNSAAAALSDDAIEFVAQRLKIGDFAVHLGQMLVRDRVHRPAGAITLIGKPDQLPHLFDREAEMPGAADEAETMKMRVRIEPIVPGGARWRR